MATPPGKTIPLKHIPKDKSDADAALTAFEAYEGQTLDLDEATRKRLLRKIDMHLMPVRCAQFPKH